MPALLSSPIHPVLGHLADLADAAAEGLIAVDGKTLRGSGHGSRDSRHLLAAYDHAHGVVLGQVEAVAKTSEIPCSPRCWTGRTSPVRD